MKKWIVEDMIALITIYKNGETAVTMRLSNSAIKQGLRSKSMNACWPCEHSYPPVAHLKSMFYITVHQDVHACDIQNTIAMLMQTKRDSR